MREKKYATSIKITDGDFNWGNIKKLFNKLSNRRGKHLMRSRYKGKGRPRKTDYEEYNSWEELKDIQAADILECGFATNYLTGRDN